MEEIKLDKRNICRTCLRCDVQLKSIFIENDSEDGEQQQPYVEDLIPISQMISACTVYPVKKNDNYPTQICVTCLGTVKIAYDFKLQCQKAYEKLSILFGVDYKENFIKAEDLYEEIAPSDKSTQTDEMGLYPCEKCEEKFFSYESLKQHRQDEHKGSENRCRVCSKTYGRITHLKRHIASAHPEMGFKADIECKHCEKRFTRPERLKRHLAVCQQKPPQPEEEMSQCDNMADSVKTECKDCKMIFTNDNEFVEHKCNANDSNTSLQIEENSELYEAEIPFTNNDGLLLIEQEAEEAEDDGGHFDAEPYLSVSYEKKVELMKEEEMSTDDDDDYKPLSELKTQGETKSEENNYLGKENNKTVVRKSGNSNKTQKKNRKSSEKEHRCEICSKVFTRSTHLKRHSFTHLDEKPFSCNVCNKGFTRLDHLNIHMHHHSDTKPYTCDLCDRGFIRANHLRAHKESRHGEKIVSPKKEFCEICKKGFTTMKYLQIHLKSHTNRAWNCKFCPEQFQTKTELTDHMKTHANEKPFLCSECGLRFVRNDYLVIHMRRHKGEKPYKCKFCGKGFPRATDLTVHERYHTGEKTHLCTVCGKGFQRAYNLLVHMRVHTGERPYQCTHCSKSFAQGNDLKAHVRRHTGERFKCEICGDGFIQGYHLTQHKRSVHGIDVKSHIRRVAKFTTPTEQQLQIHIQHQLATDPKSNEDDCEIEGQIMLPEESNIKIERIEEGVKFEDGSDNSVHNQIIDSEHGEILQSEQHNTISVLDETGLRMIAPVFLQLDQKFKYEND